MILLLLPFTTGGGDAATVDDGDLALVDDDDQDGTCYWRRACLLLSGVSAVDSLGVVVCHVLIYHRLGLCTTQHED